MDIKQARLSKREKTRTENLLGLIPTISGNALDVGARDGHFSKLLTNQFENVVALDLELPSFRFPRVQCVKGDVTQLKFPDATFDFVFCAEVLEHIPQDFLAKACEELARVTKSYLLIGVPFKQDLRVGQTICWTCGQTNPPWGHVNVFNEVILKNLFPTLQTNQVSFVEQTIEKTNSISAWLMALAGNPYGTYSQEEPCIRCGKKLIQPPNSPISRKIPAKMSILIQNFQRKFLKEQPQWIHVLFKKTC